MVAVLALQGVVLADFAIPVELFGRVRLPDGSEPYRVVTCGPSRMLRTATCDLRVRHDLTALRAADTVIVAGIDNIAAPVPPHVIAALQRAAARGSRIASICSGAFVLASAGLLDGCRATTHWRLTAELSRRHPDVRLEPDVLYVDEGAVLTSAGASAGTDLCLYLIRRDHGAAVAAESARLAVAPLERSGGQAQFIRQPLPGGHGSLQLLQDWIARHLSQRLNIGMLARRQATSVRTLHRHFLQQTGLTPARWIAQRRIRRAQELLETTTISIDAVAEAVGFNASSSFRQRFRMTVGVAPVSYRRLYRPRK